MSFAIRMGEKWHYQLYFSMLNVTIFELLESIIFQQCFNKHTAYCFGFCGNVRTEESFRCENRAQLSNDQISRNTHGACRHQPTKNENFGADSHLKRQRKAWNSMTKAVCKPSHSKLKTALINNVILPAENYHLALQFLSAHCFDSLSAFISVVWGQAG